MANVFSDLGSDEYKAIPRILSVVSSLLERKVARNERLIVPCQKKLSRENLGVFSALQVPAMNIEKYLERIFKYARCSPSVFVVAYVYIDRLIFHIPGFHLTSLNVHRLVLTSVMVATKFLDGFHYNNDHFAKVGGLKLAKLNNLEVEFLFMLRFRLHVTASGFESYCTYFHQIEVALGGGVQIEKALLCFSKTETDNSSRQLEEA
ncbi:hypothetical protein SUGI_0334130 [Cryptomeria japonica]|uniref:cyclin-U2-1-like n=1 Tax=Cryptomeria japonica TaxID=3369 RepID=UPI002408D478|nr:cyclin-U2-1-like [Cryptomeria japonica]GLJ18727.1 hypothetical protein SUGI_0334130 [Cryptomeria japonica]